MKYPYLLLDVDGTIVGTVKSPTGHDPKLKNCLDRYMEMGGKVSLVTGRSEEYTSAIYELLGLNGARIVEMGAGIIMPDNKRIMLATIDDQEKVKIRSWLEKKGVYVLMKEEPKSFMMSLILPEFPHHNPVRLREIYEGIRKEFSAAFQEIEITVDSHSIDIYNKKADKGRAIEVLAKEERIDLKKTAIVGDSRNDLPGFRVIGKDGGLVVYVGLDTEVEEQVKKEFVNHRITRNKKSEGLVELLEAITS